MAAYFRANHLDDPNSGTAIVIETDETAIEDLAATPETADLPDPNGTTHLLDRPD